MKKFIILSLFITTILSNANASNIDQENFYIGAEFGFNKINDNESSDLKELDIEYKINDDRKNIYDARLFAGVKLNKFLDIELGLSQSSKRKISAVYDSYALSLNTKAQYSLSSIDYSVLFRPFEEKSLNNLYFRVGGIYSELKGDAELNAKYIDKDSSFFYNEPTYSYYNKKESDTSKGNGFLLGIGYDINLTDSLDARLSYTRLFKVANDSDINSDRFAIGLAQKF